MLKKILLSTLVIGVSMPIYSASSESTNQLDSLTKEQKKLQADIEDKASEITETQEQLDSLNATIASNQSEIEKLSDQISEKQKDIDNQTENLKSTLQLLQKLQNQNALLAYLASDNEDNFLLRVSNVMEVGTSISKNINSVSQDLKSIKADLAASESYQAQNVENLDAVQALASSQQEIETQLQEQINSVDGEILNTKQQISLDAAKQKQEEQAAATAKAEAEAKAAAKAKADKEAAEAVDSKPTTKPEVTEPEVPEVVEPEVPEVVEPEVPEVVEPEVPDSGYNSNGDVSGDKSKLMNAAGISSSDYDYVDYIISRESSWNYLIQNSSSGAYGLCQALPGSKMSSAGSDWATNPETQMRWCNSYAVSRYGSWASAYDFWIANNWW